MKKLTQVCAVLLPLVLAACAGWGAVVTGQTEEGRFIYSLPEVNIPDGYTEAQRGQAYENASRLANLRTTTGSPRSGGPIVVTSNVVDVTTNQEVQKTTYGVGNGAAHDSQVAVAEDVMDVPAAFLSHGFSTLYEEPHGGSNFSVNVGQGQHIEGSGNSESNPFVSQQQGQGQDQGQGQGQEVGDVKAWAEGGDADGGGIDINACPKVHHAQDICVIGN